MGLQQSKVQKNFLSPSTKNNYYGGQITIDAQTNTAYQQFIIDEKNYEAFIRLIQSRKKLSHPNFLSVKNFWKKNLPKSSLSCSLEQKIQVCVQYNWLKDNLSLLLDRCSQAGKVLPETKVRGIFISIAKCLNYLQKQSTCHGDLKPQNILLDNLGNVKIIDSYFVNGGKTSYEIVMQNPSSMSFLSPQQLQKLRDKQFDSIESIHANEAFSLGLTMLETMTFEPGMECYDLEKLKIKKGYFNQKPSIMRLNGYSQQLISVVMNLITEPEENRMNFCQITQALEKTTIK